MLVESLHLNRARHQLDATWPQCVDTVSDLDSVRSALGQTHRELAWLNQQHLAVCRVPAPTFRERDRAEHLWRVFAGLGHQPQIDDAGNVVVPLVSSPELPFVALTAHMDTTLAPTGPEGIQIDEFGTMRGPGVTDNGTGLAALVGLAKILARPLVANPVRNILLVANVAEEGEGDLRGIRYLAENSPYAGQIDRYLVVDGSSLSHITHAALGSERFELVIEGSGGHSWNDFGRANPVHALARAINLMTQAKLPSRPRATLTVAVIEGGTTVNAIPCLARAKIDVRSENEDEIRRLAKIVEDSARTAVTVENAQSNYSSIDFNLFRIGSRPAAEALLSNPVADCIRAVDSHLRISSELECSSTDANIPLAAGIPAVAIGSGGRGGDAHSPSEWYDPCGRDLGLRRLILGLACLQLQG